MVVLVATAFELNRALAESRKMPPLGDNLAVLVIFVVWVILYRRWFSILSSWLYATVSLGANVTFAEAKALRRLFQVDLSFRWVPLRETRTLPKDQRHDALLETLEKYRAGRKAMLF
jgi:hypothetical protein